MSIFLSGGPASYFEGLAFDSQYNLYAAVGAYRRITKYDPSGNDTVFAAWPDVQSPLGLAFDSGENLYVADYGSNVITKFDPSGNMSTIGDVQRPFGIAIQIPEPASALLIGRFIVRTFKTQIRQKGGHKELLRAGPRRFCLR